MAKGRKVFYCPRCRNEGERTIARYRCKYCGTYFCKRHVHPEGKTKQDEKYNIITVGHPCIDYRKIKLEKEDEKSSRFLKTLDDMAKGDIVVGEIPSTITHGRKRRKLKIRLSKKMLFLLASIALFGIEFLFIEELLWPTFYIFEVFGTLYLILRTFKWASRIGVSSDLSLFGLRILSSIVAVMGAFLLYLALGSFFTSAVFYPESTPISNAFSIFLGVLGLGLVLLGSYLIFRFKLKSGKVVWVGRF